MLLGSGHRRKNESWYWLPPPLLLAPSPQPPLYPPPPSVYPSFFLLEISHPLLHARFFLQTYVRQFWGEVARSRGERCIPIMTWVVRQYSLDERGGRKRRRRVVGELRRRGGGEERRGVLSRDATSSQCVGSIFSRVNRGIPAHWSWLQTLCSVDVNEQHFVFSPDCLPPAATPLSTHRLGPSGRNTAPQIDWRAPRLSLPPHSASHAAHMHCVSHMEDWSMHTSGEKSPIIIITLFQRDSKSFNKRDET